MPRPVTTVLAAALALLCLYVSGVVAWAGGYFSVTVRTANFKPSSVTDGAATVSESVTLTDVSHSKSTSLNDSITISESSTRTDTRRPAPRDTGAVLVEVGTLVKSTPSPSPNRVLVTFASQPLGAPPAPFTAVNFNGGAHAAGPAIAVVGGQQVLSDPSPSANGDVVYYQTTTALTDVEESFSFVYSGPNSVVNPLFVNAASIPNGELTNLVESAPGIGYAGNVGYQSMSGGSIITTVKGRLPTEPYYYVVGHTYRVDAMSQHSTGMLTTRVYDVALGPQTFCAIQPYCTAAVNQGVTAGGLYPGVYIGAGRSPAILDFSFGPIGSLPTAPHPARRAFDYLNHLGFNQDLLGLPTASPKNIAFTTYFPKTLIKHVRESDGTTGYQTLNALSGQGVNVDVLTGSGDTPASLATFLPKLTNPPDSIELWNEPNNGSSTWPTPLATWAAQVQTTYGATYPIWGPSFLNTGGFPTAMQQAKPLMGTQFSAWNTHNYAQDRPESTGYGGSFSNACGPSLTEDCGIYGATNWNDNESAVVNPALPGVATEGVGSYGSYPAICGHSNVDFNTQQAYLERGLLYNFKMGHLRDFPYKFMDDGGGCTDGFGTYGILSTLVDVGGNKTYYPKPAYVSLVYLNNLLSDSGASAATFTPAPLSYSLFGASPDVEELLLAQSDGSYSLVLWSDNDLWNFDANGTTSVGAEYPLASDPVTVQFASPVNAEVFTQASGTGIWTAGAPVNATSSVNVTVNQYPLVIDIAPGAQGLASLPTAVPTVGPTETPSPGPVGSALPVLAWQTGSGTTGQYQLPTTSDGQCAGVGPTIAGQNASFTVLRNTLTTYSYNGSTFNGASTCYRNQLNPVDPATGTNFLLALGQVYRFTFQTVITLNGNYLQQGAASGGLAADLPAIVWQTHTYAGLGGACTSLVLHNTYAASLGGVTQYGSVPQGGLPVWNFHSCTEGDYGVGSYWSTDTLHDGQVDTWQIDMTPEILGGPPGAITVMRNGVQVYSTTGAICDATSSQCFWNFGPYPFLWQNSEEPPGWNSAGLTVAVNGMTLSKPTPSPTAGPGAEMPIQADRFVDSLGMNTHLIFGNNVSLYGAINADLVSLGVRHIRDGWHLGGQPPSYPAELQTLAASGIHADLLQWFGETTAQIQAIPAAVNPALEAEEVTNEWDCNWNAGNGGTWQSTLATSMQTLYAAVSGAYPVYGPAFCRASSYALAGSLATNLDFGNLHNYQGGWSPGTSGFGGPTADCGNVFGYGSIDYNLGCVANVSGPLTFAQSIAYKGPAPGNPFDSYTAPSGSKPVVTTEIGIGTMTAKANNVDQATYAKYIARTFLLQYAAGIARTYWYVLQDDNTPCTVGGECMGVVDVNGANPKPGFFVLKNLIAALTDPGAVFSPTPLAFTFSGSPPYTLAHMLFQKRSGRYTLALWNETPSWNVNGGTTGLPVTVTPATITVNLPAAPNSLSVQAFNDAGSLVAVTPTIAGSAVTFSVDDHVTLMSFGP